MSVLQNINNIVTRAFEDVERAQYARTGVTADAADHFPAFSPGPAATGPLLHQTGQLLRDEMSGMVDAMQLLAMELGGSPLGLGASGLGNPLLQETAQLLQHQASGMNDAVQMLNSELGGAPSFGLGPGFGPPVGASPLLQETRDLLQHQMGGMSDAMQMLNSELGSGHCPGASPVSAFGPSTPTPAPAGLTTGPNNSVSTGRYTVQVSDKNDGQVTITDNFTGKKDVVWGDPHLKTDKGTADFQHSKLTVRLDDGTNVTIDPTKGSGKNFIDSVDITKGQEGVEFSGVHDGKIKMSQTATQGGLMDLLNHDAIKLDQQNGDLSDLQVEGGPAIKGRVGNLDRYESD